VNFGNWLKDQQKLAYHITFKHLLPSIQNKGLLPNKPEDYAGELKGVFLFKTIDDAENALTNWLGERIEDLEEKAGFEFEELLLTIDISNLNCINGAGYELVCLNVIPPNRIINITPI